MKPTNREEAFHLYGNMNISLVNVHTSQQKRIQVWHRNMSWGPRLAECFFQTTSDFSRISVYFTAFTFTFYPHKPAAERHHHASGNVYDDVQCNMVFSLMARELNIGLSDLRFSFQLTTKSPTCLLENYSRDIKSLLLSSAFSSSLCTFQRLACSRPIYSCVILFPFQHCTSVLTLVN